MLFNVTSYSDLQGRIAFSIFGVSLIFAPGQSHQLEATASVLPAAFEASAVNSVKNSGFDSISSLTYLELDIT